MSYWAEALFRLAIFMACWFVALVAISFVLKVWVLGWLRKSGFIE